MNFQEKLRFIEDNHFGEWLKERRKVADEFSDKQTMFCVCGKLATGMYESYCRKLQTAITKETVKRLDVLFATVK